MGRRKQHSRDSKRNQQGELLKYGHCLKVLVIKKYVFDTVNILWDLFFTNRNSLHQKLPKKVTSCKEQQQPERRQELPSESCAGDHEPPASPIRNALGQVNMQMFSVISLFEATEAVCIFGLFWFFSSPTFVTSLQYI